MRTPVAAIIAAQLIAAHGDREKKVVAAHFPLRYLGDPILRAVAEKVVDGESVPPGLVTFMVDMCKRSDVAGISAPQLGMSKQLMVFVAGGKIQVFFNPSNVHLTGRIQKNSEGCLSIPGFRTQVPRHTEITFSYDTGSRENRTVSFYGADAFVAQHEFDHLSGVLITDYISRQQKRQAERVVQEYLRKRS